MPGGLSRCWRRPFRSLVLFSLVAIVGHGDDLAARWGVITTGFRGPTTQTLQRAHRRSQSSVSRGALRIPSPSRINY